MNNFPKIVLIVCFVTALSFSTAFISCDGDSDDSANNACTWELAEGYPVCVNFDSTYPYVTENCNANSGTLLTTCTETTLDGYVGQCDYTQDGYSHTAFFYADWSAPNAQNTCEVTYSGTWIAAP